MIKLVCLYTHPSDPAAFDRHYHDIHMPLVRQVPGLAKVEVARITGAPRGESPYYVITEMYWATADAMQSSMASPEMRAVGRDAREFAGDLLTMHVAEVLE